MNIADILSEFGSFYLGSGNQENRDRLYNALYQPSVTADLFTYIPTTATRWRGARALMAQVIQPWQQTFSPTDPLTMEPKVVDLYKIKIDLSENPDELEDSWLGFLARLKAAGNLDRTQWPFIRWFIEEHVIPRAKEEMELSAIFWGVHVTPVTSGTAGAAVDAIDGINKKIADYITAGDITPITMGAPDADPATYLGQLEDMVKTVRGVNPKYSSKPMEMMIEHSNYLHARRGFRSKYGVHSDFDGEKDMIIDSNVRLVGCPSMSADPNNAGAKSNKAILTFKENRLRVAKLDRNINQFQVESNSPRKVDIYSDWWEVYDFLMPDLVFVNDQ